MSKGEGSRKRSTLWNGGRKKEKLVFDTLTLSCCCIEETTCQSLVFIVLTGQEHFWRKKTSCPGLRTFLDLPVDSLVDSGDDKRCLSLSFSLSLPLFLSRALTRSQIFKELPWVARKCKYVLCGISLVKTPLWFIHYRACPLVAVENLWWGSALNVKLIRRMWEIQEIFRTKSFFAPSSTNYTRRFSPSTHRRSNTVVSVGRLGLGRFVCSPTGRFIS